MKNYSFMVRGNLVREVKAGGKDGKYFLFNCLKVIDDERIKYIDFGIFGSQAIKFENEFNKDDEVELNLSISISAPKDKEGNYLHKKIDFIVINWSSTQKEFEHFNPEIEMDDDILWD